MIYTLIILGFTLGYILLISWYYKVWNCIEDNSNLSFNSKFFVSVVIPARNESEHIQKTIQSILNQSYPSTLFEIIVVDDHSEDNTSILVADMNKDNVQLVSMKDIPLQPGEVAYKKRSIEEGVKVAKGEIIVTTDADCTHHKDWLKTIVSSFEHKKVNMISGPVLFNYENNWFQKFQALDFLGMIGITASSIKLGMFNLANGANLAYRKSVFNQVGGFAGIDKKASGDDMLLIYKFAQVDASKVVFLKSNKAIVYTDCAKNLNEFIQQRLRWTSKSFEYQDKRITYILAFVYLVNVLLFTSLLLALLKMNAYFALLFFAQFTAMSLVDFIFLKKVSEYFDRNKLLKAFVPSQFIHVVYILIIGLLGNIIPYQWKGRNLK
mgnify:CR=1 FL=1